MIYVQKTQNGGQCQRPRQYLTLMTVCAACHNHQLIPHLATKSRCSGHTDPKFHLFNDLNELSIGYDGDARTF
jgi:hypothetical protein